MSTSAVILVARIDSHDELNRLDQICAGLMTAAKHSLGVEIQQTNLQDPERAMGGASKQSAGYLFRPTYGFVDWVLWQTVDESKSAGSYAKIPGTFIEGLSPTPTVCYLWGNFKESEKKAITQSCPKIELREWTDKDYLEHFSLGTFL